MTHNQYRGFYISHDRPPIPTDAFDWSASNGEGDNNGEVHFHGRNLSELKQQIDEHWEQAA